MIRKTFITSNGYRVFWLHHANIDRIWYQWQRDFGEYGFTYNGMTEENRTVSMEDEVDVGYLNRFLPAEYQGGVMVVDSIRWCFTNYSNSL
jgi:hypothetical protein